MMEFVVRDYAQIVRDYIDRHPGVKVSEIVEATGIAKPRLYHVLGMLRRYNLIYMTGNSHSPITPPQYYTVDK